MAWIAYTPSCVVVSVSICSRYFYLVAISHRGIYQLIEAYMLSLQTDPLSEDLKQQVAAVSRDLESKECPGEGDEMEVTPPAVPESRGQVEYFVQYCLDKYPMTYKTLVVYPREGLAEIDRTSHCTDSCKITSAIGNVPFHHRVHSAVGYTLRPRTPTIIVHLSLCV